MRSFEQEIPTRIALGRWENERTFWCLLVERYRLPHLGSPRKTPGSALRDRFALGGQVFGDVHELPLPAQEYEILRRTEAIIRSPRLRVIYFDVTGISEAGKKFASPSLGYFARRELELVVIELDLFRKTRFFENGTPLWQNGVDLRQLLLGRNRRRLRPALLDPDRQRRYLDELLER